MQVLETSIQVRKGVLFDNHVGDEEAFNFCEKQGFGFIVSPMNVGENERKKLVGKVRERGLWTSYVFGRAEGQFGHANIQNEENAVEMESFVRERWIEADKLFEDDARLFHDLTLQVRDDFTKISEARKAALYLSKDQENAAPVFFLDVLQIIVELRRATQPLRRKSEAFFNQLLEHEKRIPNESEMPLDSSERLELEEFNRQVRARWLNKVYDVELLRYTRAFENIILCTKDIVLQRVADKMRLPRVQDMVQFGS